jgi:hypothetical protein
MSRAFLIPGWLNLMIDSGCYISFEVREDGVREELLRTPFTFPQAFRNHLAEFNGRPAQNGS